MRERERGGRAGRKEGRRCGAPTDSNKNILALNLKTLENKK